MKKFFLVFVCVVFCLGGVELGMGMKEKEKKPTAEEMLKEIQDLKVPDILTTENIEQYLNHLQNWPYKFETDDKEMNDDFYITTASVIATRFNALIEKAKGTNFEAMVIAYYSTIASINAWNRRLDEIIRKDLKKKKDVDEAKKLLHQNPIVKLLVMQWDVKNIDYLDRTKEELKNAFELVFNAVKLYEELVKDEKDKELLCGIYHQDCLIPGLFRVIFNLPYTAMKTWLKNEFITQENLEEYKKTFLSSIYLYINSEFPKNKTIYEKTSALCSETLKCFYTFFVFQQKISEKLESFPTSLSSNYLEDYKTAKAELFSDLKKTFGKNESLTQFLDVLNIRLSILDKTAPVKDEFFALVTADPLQQALMLLKAKLLHLAQTLGEK